MQSKDVQSTAVQREAYLLDDEEVSSEDSYSVERAEPGMIFPWDSCCCLPQVLRRRLPRGWYLIQDATHLILLAGFFSGMLKLFIEVWWLARGGPCFDGNRVRCGYRFIFIVLSILPNLCYIANLIHRFDESLMEKDREVRFRKEQILNTYQILLDDVHSLLLRATQSSAFLSENAFENARAGFIRFLGRMASACKSLSGEETEKRKIATLLAQLIQIWLKVFSECSDKPLSKPKCIFTAAEIDDRLDLQELVLFVQERVTGTEVRFLTTEAYLDVRTFHPPEIQRSAGEKGEQEARAGLLLGSVIPCRWVNLGCVGCRVCTRRYKGFWPRVLGLQCMEVVFLTFAHVRILIGAILGTAWIVDSLPDPFAPTLQITRVLEAPIMFMWVLSLCVFLIRIEKLDIISQLELEIRELESERLRLDDQLVHIQRFWGDVQRLASLWIHRTTPRQELLAEVMEDLEKEMLPSTVPMDWISHLDSVNEALLELEASLPPLEAWFEGGSLEEAQKKAFSQSMRGLIEMPHRDLAFLLKMLRESIDTGVFAASPGSMEHKGSGGKFTRQWEEGDG